MKLRNFGKLTLSISDDYIRGFKNLEDFIAQGKKQFTGSGLSEAEFVKKLSGAYEIIHGKPERVEKAKKSKDEPDSK